MTGETQIPLAWKVRTCFNSDVQETSAGYEQLGRLLVTLHCLPGSGYLIVIPDFGQPTRYPLPFANGFAPAALRSALFNTMMIGGGCEIRLDTPQASLVLGTCLRFGQWRGCTAEQVRISMDLNSREIPVTFPAPGSVERIK